MANKETKGGGPILAGASKSTETGKGKPVLSIPEKLTPHNIFERCIKRAQNLINFNVINDKAEEKEEYFDAYRAAIVLSISALDAFIRTIVTEKINEKLISKTELSEKLSDYLKELLNQDKLLDAARKSNLQEVVDQHIKEDFGTKAFQGDWKIRSFMEMIGYKDIFQEVSKSADINKDNLIKKLETYTQRRHIIAHSGDYDLNSTVQTENKINKAFAQDCVDLVTKFADHVHKICYKQ